MSAGDSNGGLSGFPFGNRARDLLVELRRSDWLSPYNDEGVRQVISEINALHQQVRDRLPADGSGVNDPSLASPLLVFHSSILRNKRCLLAYLRFRVDKLRDLRWEHGPVLAVDLRARVSPREAEFFNGYDKLLGSYMRDLDLDLSADLQPPKHLYIEVRVLQDCGEILTDSGPVVLEKNSTHYLRRSDVEHLIRQNLLEQLD